MKLEDIKKSKENDTTEMPTIIFKDNELEFAVANWFENGKTAKEGMSKILFELGYRNGEVVILDDFDMSNFSFACTTDSNKNMRITLVPSSNEENAVVIAETEGTKKVVRTYEYLQDRIEHLKPYDCKATNKINNNTFSQTFCQYHWEAVITNENDKETYTFYIKAVKPKTNAESYTAKKDSFFELDNVEELEKYLLGLSFPVNLEEVYKKLCEISLTPVSKFPNLFISETLETKVNESKTTNSIWMSDGRINEFIITRNGYTVSIDDNGWTCESDDTSISQDKKGNISYNIISIPEKAFFNLDPISNRFIVTKIVVENVKRLIKTLFNRNI